MKCFGIFAIYLGHFGPDGGYSYDFVFTHHVALFFFVSGCTEALSASDRKIVPYIKNGSGRFLSHISFSAYYPSFFTR